MAAPVTLRLPSEIIRDSVRLTAQLENRNAQGGQAMTVAIIGLPSGVELFAHGGPAQLRTLDAWEMGSIWG